jgi:Protein of unknown function (DUF3311)
MGQSARPGKSPVLRGTVTILLLIAIGGALCVPAYARYLPELGAFPFFYWFQLIWVPVVAMLCALCYLLMRTSSPRRARGGNGRGGRR